MDLSAILMCPNGNKKTREKTITNSTLFDYANQLRLRVATLFLLGLVITQAIPKQATLNAEEFKISLQSGTVITVDVKTPTLKWTRVSDSGESREETLKIAELNRIMLSDSPVGQKVDIIRQLITDLADPSFRKREAAEDKLSEAETAGQFMEMLQSNLDHPDFEVRYRINRILKRLEDQDSTQRENQFDRLFFKNGMTAEGDLGNLNLELSFRGQPLKLKREQIAMISTPSNKPKLVASDKKTEVEIFHKPLNIFYRVDQTRIDFEKSPSGEELRRPADVSQTFVPVGLKLGTEQKGYIGISGYGFKFGPEKRASGNSICVYETVGTYSKRFKGIMEISFCMPNQESVAAGVMEFGMQMARVNHSRDFIVEAYNADNQILASVESSDEPCVFSGIKSTQPIAKIRILSNPHLFRIDRAIDEDYAVDSICFSPPVPIDSLTPQDQPSVTLNNGDLLKTDNIKLSDADAISINPVGKQNYKIGFDEIRSINFNHSSQKDRKSLTRLRPKQVLKTWTAMISDGSILFIEPGIPMTSTLFPKVQLELETFTGMWLTRNPSRFPMKSDFEKGKNVIVFPTCRIIPELISFAENGFQWNGRAEKIMQDLVIEGDEKDQDDPTPNIDQVTYETASAESSPTIWLKPPRSINASQGRIILADGQQLVLNGDLKIQLVNIQEDKITISIGKEIATIPLDQIQIIEFPERP